MYEFLEENIVPTLFLGKAGIEAMLEGHSKVPETHVYMEL